ncbi:hypothetical protein ACOMHN_018126 [Nucella lapillus]
MLRWPQMSWLLTSTLRTWPWLLTSTMLQTSTMQTSWLLTSTVQTSWLLTSTMLLTSTVQTSWLLTSTVLLTSTQLARQDYSKETTGRHADISDGCKSYHICLEGSYYDRMYCPPRTIFNEALQVCDYPGDAPSPCGLHKVGCSSTPQGPWPEYTVIG